VSDANVNSNFRLDNRIIVITGGAGFLGIQHAEAVLEAGGVPVLFDLKEEVLNAASDRLLSTHGHKPLTVVSDITDERSIENAIDRVVNECGRLDGLINNAAFAGRVEFGQQYFAAVEEYPLAAWRRTVEVNLTGTFIATKFALRAMMKQGHGVFVNIASDVGIVSPDPRIYEELKSEQRFNTPLSYSATKAAIINFTRHIATHYAQCGIRANSISPAGMSNNQPEEFVKLLAKLIPLGRMAKRGEYKAAIVFLLSDASAFMTGSNLVIDGGRTAW
jgi:NAD(P)-dependent dehydrogenase (short-subunit alcohol dehydrogenase family)